MKRALTAAAALLAACSSVPKSDPQPPALDCAPGEHVQRDELEFCVYVGPTVEPGFDCPELVPYEYPLGDDLVCASEAGLPDETVRDVLEGGGGAGGGQAGAGGVGGAGGSVAPGGPGIGLVAWARSMASPVGAEPDGNAGYDRARALGSDAEGNVFVGGHLGNVPFVSKYSVDGDLLWSHEFTGGFGGEVNDLAVDPHGAVILSGEVVGAVDFGGGLVGRPDRDGTTAFFVKLSPAGEFLWNRTSTGPMDYGHAVAVDAESNVYGGGWFTGTRDFGGGPVTAAGERDAFLVKYSPDGAHLWSTRIGGPATDSINGLAVSTAGDLFAVGAFMDHLEADGDLLEAPAGRENGLVLALSAADGSIRWARSPGGAIPADVVVMDDRVFVSGSADDTPFGRSSSGSDPFVACWDRDGALVWGRVFDGAHGGGRSIAADGRGGLYLATDVNSSTGLAGEPVPAATFDYAVVARIDPANGALGRTAYFPGEGPGRSIPWRIAVDRSGAVALAGSFSLGVELGGVTLRGDESPGPFSDAFVARLLPPP